MTAKQFLLRALQEPLLHFLAVGALLFVAYELSGIPAEQEASKTIVVSSDRLFEFVQFRSKTLGPESIRQQMEKIPATELQLLIDNFVREEALYREAKSLGLDEKDIGVRQRMVRQLEFINQGFVSSGLAFSDTDLKDYLEQNQARYFEPPTITFTHVFFNADRRGDEAARQSAAKTLEVLRGSGDTPPVAFHEAPAHGDRFLYRQNYVNQEADEVKSHFGAEMQQSVFELEPDDQAWRGPYRSLYGYHLVLATKKTDRRLPEFAELRNRLEADAYQSRLDEQTRELEKSVLDSYVVVLDEDLRMRLGSEAKSPPDEHK